MGRGNNVGVETKFKVDPGWYEYDGMVMTSHTPPEALDKAKKFEFRDDDVLCACYPKTGQTWMLSLLYMMKHSDELETGRPLTSSREQDIPFMELEWPVGSGNLIIDDLSSRSSPRYIKTHLPVHFFKESLARTKAKVIQVIRNPKDTLVSYYHFHRANEALGNYEGSWHDFFEMVRENDHITWGDMFEHTLGWWNLAKERKDNIVFFYEDMKQDLKSTVQRLADFLGKKLSDDVINTIVHKATFSNMKKDKDLKIQQDIDDPEPPKETNTDNTPASKQDPQVKEPQIPIILQTENNPQEHKAEQAPNTLQVPNGLQVSNNLQVPGTENKAPVTKGLKRVKTMNVLTDAISSNTNVLNDSTNSLQVPENKGMKRVASAPSCLIWSRRGKKEQVAPFMRSGMVGDWQKHFTKEESDFVDKRVKEILEPVGLKFTYAL